MRYIYNSEVFTKEDHNSFYLLGLFYSDGNVYSNGKSYECSIKSIDVSLLNSIKNLVCLNKPLIKVKNSNCYKLVFNNKIIYNWLNSWGCVPNKTKILKFPNIPEKYISHFMRGLIDGDGSIGFYKKPILRFDSASIDLIDSFNQKLNAMQLNCSVTKTKWIVANINGRETKSTTQMYRLTLTNLKCYKFIKYLYKNAELFLDRKKIIADQIINFYEKEFKSKKLLEIDNLNDAKWLQDDELVNLVISHKGSLKNSAKELGLSAWSFSQRLRKINKYNYIRELFPVKNIDNIRNNSSPRKLKISEEIKEEIYNLIDQDMTYSNIAKKYNLNVHYIAFLQRRRIKK